jgi:hypothetical protein
MPGLPVPRMALTAAHASHICRSRAYTHPVLLWLPRDSPWPPRLLRELLTEQVRTGTNPTQGQTSPASAGRGSCSVANSSAPVVCFYPPPPHPPTHTYLHCERVHPQPTSALVQPIPHLHRNRVHAPPTAVSPLLPSGTSFSAQRRCDAAAQHTVLQPHAPCCNHMHSVATECHL